MKRPTLTARLATVCATFSLSVLTAVAAEPTDSLQLTGNVRDARNYDYLWNVRVELLSPADSTVLYADSCRNHLLLYSSNARDFLRRNHTDNAPYIRYQMRVRPGKYLLRCSRDGYTTKVVPLTIPAKRYGRATREWKAEDVILSRLREQQLGEATVRATRILMVNKGDTVVFNADYFNLSQGNMLDQLVKMLPGMEIRNNGQIYYNGKLLPNLLVNGKDFFQGDPKVALQNLPAYMVKSVKVYEKEAETAFLNRHRDSARIKTPNTLDVVLKKEYSHGWVANAQVGGGPATGTDRAWTNAKYLAKLFGLYYLDHMRLCVMGNMNNVSNTEVANDEGGWYSGWNPGNGELKLVFGGLNFNYNSKKHHLDYVMNLKGTKEVTERESVTSSTTFLPGGDTYNRSHAAGRNNMPHAVMNHRLTWSGNKAYANLFTGVDYFGQSNTSRSRSAQFAADPCDSYRTASLDSVFTDGYYSPRLDAILTNRVETNRMERGGKWAQITHFNTSFNDPFLGNTLSFRLSSYYTKSHTDKYEHYDLRYGKGNAAPDDFRNRYFDLGGRDYNGGAWADYSFDNMMSAKTIKIFKTSVHYSYNHHQYHGHSLLYNLHLLDSPTGSPEAETAAPADVPPLGALPSVAGWKEQCRDANSYYLDRNENFHELKVHLRLGQGSSKWGYLQAEPALNVRNERYADSRADERGQRRLATLRQLYSYNWMKSFGAEEGKRTQIDFSVGYSAEYHPVALNYLLDIRDDSNPLSVSLGNKDLRNAFRRNVTGDFNVYFPSTAGLHLNFSHRTTQDDVAMGCTYDSRTGVYTYKPQNVDGNRNTYLNFRFDVPFGKDRNHRLDGVTSWSGIHSVDIIDEALSVVNNQVVTQQLSLTSRFGKVAVLTLGATARRQYASSERANFRTRRTWDLSYGPKLQINPAADVNVSTDFKVFQRRGYDDRSMNDTEWVWNATLNWNFDFRRSSYRHSVTENGVTRKEDGSGARPWSLSLTAHDILQQLGNTRRHLNTQGITETWYKSVPSYFMLNLTYRFARKPKGQNAI